MSYRPGLEAFVTDAFNLDWSNLNVYVPPFKYYSKGVKQVEERGSKGGLRVAGLANSNMVSGCSPVTQTTTSVPQSKQRPTSVAKLSQGNRLTITLLMVAGERPHPAARLKF